MTAKHHHIPPGFQVISGGQTGVDRAGLDAALEAGISVGGWCPRGRRAMDGRIPMRYPLTETEASDYAGRTERNVRNSDATLIFNAGILAGGTRLTTELAQQYEKPLFIVDLKQPPDYHSLADWLFLNNVHVLNIAGPREESHPGCYALARTYLSRLFSDNY